MPDSISQIVRFHSDTIQINDTSSSTIMIMNGIEPISCISTENWVGYLLLGLFGMLVLSWIMDKNVILKHLVFPLKLKERVSIFTNTTLTNFYSQALFYLFSLGIIALDIQIVLFKEERIFSGIDYTHIVCYCAAFFGIKYVLMSLFHYVFFNNNKQNDKTLISEYFRILGLISFLLFVITFLCTYSFRTSADSLSTVIIIISITTLLLLTTRMFQFFLHKKLALLYIILYLCTFETLPFLALLKLLKFRI